LNELALFAGAGGGILAGQLLGWKTVCAVERDAYPAAVLAQRQNDGLLDLFPIWSDVCTFDGKPWRGIVDVISGGFPCQDISAAGKGAGIDGERSGLWSEFKRIICEVRPLIVYVENSPILTSRGLGRVLGDLASIGYDAEWGVLGAAGTGADHQRNRIWIVAYSNSARLEGMFCREFKSISKEKRKSSWGEPCRVLPKINEWALCQTKTCLCRKSNDMASRVDRLKAIGNGQVPQCAAEAFTRLIDRIKSYEI
jgi:DNA (cytosine-5)-methyltransferase 1